MLRLISTYFIFVNLFNLVFAQSPGGVNTSLKAWYKSNGSVTTTGTTITAWNNEVSGGVNLTNTKGVPVLSASNFNFNPTATFDGDDVIANQSVTGDNFITSTTNTSFIAFTSAVPGSTAAVISKWDETGNSNQNRISWEITNTGFLRFDFPISPTPNFTSATTITNQSFIGSASTTSTLDSLRLNGLLEGVRNYSPATSDPTKTGRFQIGANYSNLSFPFNGNIGEVIFYNAVLNESQKRRVESYLALKYGITLGNTANPITYLASNGTTVMWNGSPVFQNNVAGIGRDDNSSLLQKQSRSSNASPNNIVTMSLGPIQVSNAANSSTIATNRTFLVWGDNNASVVPNSTDVPSGILEKSQRIWRVKETGTIGSVRVRFSLGSTALAPYNVDFQNVRLLVDGDGVFGTGATTISPTSYNNATDEVEFDYNFSDGNYFTLGFVNVPLPIDLISFTIAKKNNNNELFWTVKDAHELVQSIVYKSADLQNWTKIGTIESSSSSQIIQNFNFTDQHHSPHVVYYRLETVDLAGNRRKSKWLSSTFESNLNSVQIEENEASFRILNNSQETIHVKIINYNASVSQEFELIGSTSTEFGDLLKPGIYLAVLSSSNGELMVRKIIKY